MEGHTLNISIFATHFADVKPSELTNLLSPEGAHWRVYESMPGFTQCVLSGFDFMKTNWNDYLNQKFGKLTIIEILPNVPYKLRRCIALCECGNKKEFDIGNIKRGISKSCGCLYKGIHSIHGMSNTRIYKIYTCMLDRCHKTNIKHYKYYGARGIKVCDEWRDDFMNFYNWAMDNGYNDELTIERKDVNGNYEPSNCTWATTKEQANNKTCNVLITYKGITKNLTQWADIIGCDMRLIWKRLQRGWDVEKALETTFERKRSTSKRIEIIIT